MSPTPPNIAPPKDLALGIDPGFTGAIAVYRYVNGDLLNIFDMPLTEPSRLSPSHVQARHTIDPAQLFSLLSPYAPRIALAVLERVHACPDQGVVSTFRFGEGYGMVQGVLAALGLRTLLPIPAVWKVSMGVTSQKETSLAAARSLVSPEKAAVHFTRKKDHGRAEAFLLAVYGSKSLKLESMI